MKKMCDRRQKGIPVQMKLHRDLLVDFSVSDRIELCELCPVIEFLRNAYLTKGMDSVEVVYSRSINPLTHEQISNKILPMLNLSDEMNALKTYAHFG
jgi:F0F1-type ATP synthase gamma subunit